MNTQLEVRQEMPFDKKAYKLKWQKEYRRNFMATRGYSSASDYACGGLRAKVLERDGNACVKCRMTDAEHKAKWGRPITIDHRDRNRSNNTLENLQTMCLTCHGRKDYRPELNGVKAPAKRNEIMSMRQAGMTYQGIADNVGISIAIVWKWIKRWEKQTTT